MGEEKVKKVFVKKISLLIALVMFGSGAMPVVAAEESHAGANGDAAVFAVEESSADANGDTTGLAAEAGVEEKCNEDVFEIAELLTADAEKNGDEYDGYVFQAAEGYEDRVDKIVEDIIDEKASSNLSSASGEVVLGENGSLESVSCDSTEDGGIGDDSVGSDCVGSGSVGSGSVGSDSTENDSCMEILENSDGVYTADSLEDIKENIPEKYIEYIEPDYYVYLDYSVSAPNDTYYNYNSYQYNLSKMNVEDVWALGIEGQDLDDSVDMDYDGNSSNDTPIIAILDSGLYMEHEDIDYTRVVSPINLYPDSTDDSDEIGHGTFIAGMLIAKKNNQEGIAGIGQSFKIQPVKVFSSTGKTKSSVLASSLNYVTQEKTDFVNSRGKSGLNISVVNMSFGTDTYITSLKNAVSNAEAAGLLLVASAGNNGDTTAQYPAQFCIGVGSTTKDDEVSSFSEIISSDNGTGYENKVWVSAPGTSVTSVGYTSTDGYRIGSGTSFSAPEVAALGAICKSIDNDITQSEFKALLKDTAVRKTSTQGTTESGQDLGFGWGVVDFAAAVKSLLGDMSGTVTATIQARYSNGTASAKATKTLYTVSSDNLGNDIKGDIVLPDANGTYILTKGQRYIYSVREPLCDTVEGTLAAVNSRSLVCDLEKAAEYGDIDADGAITVKDAGMMLLYASCGDLLGLSQPFIDAIDVNADGSSNTEDAICLLEYITGKTDSLPAAQS